MEQEQLRQTIAAAQAGSAEGYEALLAAYGSRLYGYFYRATARHHDAEDLLGELMLRLVRRLGSYDDRGRFEPWLFRIAANMVRDRIRRRRTNPTPASLSADEDSGASMADNLPGASVPVDAAALGREDTAALNEALAKLELKTREMILLRHFGGMSFKEIDALFDCPLGTVLARVHRGVKALRKIMRADDAIE